MLCHPYIESAITLKIIAHAFSEPDSASTTVVSSGRYVTGKNSSRPREALKMNKDMGHPGAGGGQLESSVVHLCPGDGQIYPHLKAWRLPGWGHS